MPIITIESDDQVLAILKQVKSNRNLITKQLTPAQIADGFSESYTFNAAGMEEITNSNGQVFSNYEFSFNTDSKVSADQTSNFNSTVYHNSNLGVEEKSLTSIYQTTSEQNSFLLENAKKESFANPFLSIEMMREIGNMEQVSLGWDLDKTTINKNKNTFPFYISLNFTNTENRFFNMLKDNHTYDLLIEAIHNTGFGLFEFSTDRGPLMFRAASLESVMDNINMEKATWQLTHFPNSEYKWGNKFSTINKFLLRNQINNMAEDYSPTYSALLSNEKESTYEIFCYRVEKKLYGQVGTTQVFYIPATDGNRDFIDTQIKYGSNYLYKIDAIGIAYGNTYEYNNTVTGLSANVLIKQQKTIQFFKLNLLTYITSVYGIAPTTPNITFYKNSENKNKLKLFFEPNLHEVRQNFISIQNSDMENQSYAKTVSGGVTIFKPTKEIFNYQIFKLNNKPKSYEDFKNSLYGEVMNEDAESETTQIHLSTNKKFYFIFRSVNGFGLYSNPTPIYEVELVEDSDGVTIVTKIVNIEDKQEQVNRQFGRFMRIYPAYEQILIKEFEGSDPIEQPDTLARKVEDYYVGISDHPVWGKKFKIRVKSKNTGKTADFNVDFVLKKIETEEDFT